MTTMQVPAEQPEELFDILDEASGLIFGPGECRLSVFDELGSRLALDCLPFAWLAGACRSS